MARPREFDKDQALEGAMEVFWERSYESSSMPDLLDGMGIARGSLYKAFKGKKELFLLALERYDQTSVARAVDLLSGDAVPDGWQRISMLFEGAVTAARRGDRRGCLLCTAAAGPAAYDPEVAEELNRMFARFTGAFEAALQDSPRHSHLDRARRKALAQALMTQYAGLRILARSHAPVSALKASVKALNDLAGAS